MKRERGCFLVSHAPPHSNCYAVDDAPACRQTRVQSLHLSRAGVALPSLFSQASRVRYFQGPNPATSMRCQRVASPICPLAHSCCHASFVGILAKLWSTRYTHAGCRSFFRTGEICQLAASVAGASERGFHLSIGRHVPQTSVIALRLDPRVWLDIETLSLVQGLD